MRNYLKQYSLWFFLGYLGLLFLTDVYWSFGHTVLLKMAQICSGIVFFLLLYVLFRQVYLTLLYWLNKKK